MKSSSEIERDLKLEANNAAITQDHIDQASNLEDKKHFSEELDRNKANLAALRTEAQRLTTVQQDVQQRLKTAEERLDDIEKELKAVVEQNGKR